MAVRVPPRPLAAALVAAVYIASALAFGSLSGTSGATTEDVATEAEYRAALTALSGDATGPHTINITADFFITDPGGDGDPTYTGTQPLTIDGGGHTVGCAVNNMRFLHHDSTAALTLEDITVEDCERQNAGGAVRSDGGDVTIERSTLRDNTALNQGGALQAGGVTVIIRNSTLSGNSSPGQGGAIAAGGSGSLTIENSTLSGNSSPGNGGAIWANVVTIQNSTLSGNTAGGLGGAVIAFLDLALIHATVAGNTAPTGANIHATTDISSFGSVVADPRGEGTNCEIGGDTTSTYSYEESDDSCGFTDDTDTENGPDPQLGPLANNGGPTQTMLPQPGSPLIDAIPEEDCELDTDQRGVSRPQDGDEDGVFACDIGAVEVEGPAEDARAPAARPVEGDPTFTG